MPARPNVLILDNKADGDVVFQRLTFGGETFQTLVYTGPVLYSMRAEWKNFDFFILGLCPELLHTDPDLMSVANELVMDGFAERILIVGESVKPPKWINGTDLKHYCLRSEIGRWLKSQIESKSSKE